MREKEGGEGEGEGEREDRKSVMLGCEEITNRRYCISSNSLHPPNRPRPRIDRA